jgi:hypothetical protein
LNSSFFNVNILLITNYEAKMYISQLALKQMNASSEQNRPALKQPNAPSAAAL